MYQTLRYGDDKDPEQRFNSSCRDQKTVCKIYFQKCTLINSKIYFLDCLNKRRIISSEYSGCKVLIGQYNQPKKFLNNSMSKMENNLKLLQDFRYFEETFLPLFRTEKVF